MGEDGDFGRVGTFRDIGRLPTSGGERRVGRFGETALVLSQYGSVALDVGTFGDTTLAGFLSSCKSGDRGGVHTVGDIGKSIGASRSGVPGGVRTAWDGCKLSATGDLGDPGGVGTVGDMGMLSAMGVSGDRGGLRNAGDMPSSGESDERWGAGYSGESGAAG